MNREQTITAEIRESASSRKPTAIKHTTTTVQDLCHLKKFIQLQQSNMETFPHTFARIVMLPPVFWPKQSLRSSKSMYQGWKVHSYTSRLLYGHMPHIAMTSLVHPQLLWGVYGEVSWRGDVGGSTLF